MAALAHHGMSYAEQKDAIDDDPAHVWLSTAGGKEGLAGGMRQSFIADYVPVEDAVVADEQALINEQFAASLSVTDSTSKPTSKLIRRKTIPARSWLFFI